MVAGFFCQVFYLDMLYMLYIWYNELGGGAR